MYIVGHIHCHFFHYAPRINTVLVDQNEHINDEHNTQWWWGVGAGAMCECECV